MPGRLYKDLVKQFPSNERDRECRIISTYPILQNRQASLDGIESIEVLLLDEKFYERFFKGLRTTNERVEELARDVFRDIDFDFLKTDDACTVSFARVRNSYYPGHSIVVREPLITPKVRIILRRDNGDLMEQQRNSYFNFVWEMYNLFRGEYSPRKR